MLATVADSGSVNAGFVVQVLRHFGGSQLRIDGWWEEENKGKRTKWHTATSESEMALALRTQSVSDKLPHPGVPNILAKLYDALDSQYWNMYKLFHVIGDRMSTRLIAILPRRTTRLRRGMPVDFLFRLVRR